MARKVLACPGGLPAAFCAFAIATALLLAGYYFALSAPAECKEAPQVAAPPRWSGTCPSGCRPEEIVHNIGDSPPPIIAQLRKELYDGADPYALLDDSCSKSFKLPDSKHRGSRLGVKLVQSVLGLVTNGSRTGRGPALWLELGSYVGSSAIRVAASIRASNMSTGLLAVDPFTGDTEMWFQQREGRKKKSSFDHLYADSFGEPRIYELFLANMRSTGYRNIVLPLRTTAVAGMRLLSRLKKDDRLESLPEVIYLDTAGEREEAFLELGLAWKILQAPGVMFGDTWSRPAVRADVTRFALGLNLASLSAAELRKVGGKKAEQPVPGLAVSAGGKGAWLLYKKPH